jgi:hypothetical protein
LSTAKIIRYTKAVLILFYGWEEDQWNSSLSPSVRNAILETLYPYPISAVRALPSIIRHGFAPILIAATT